MVWAVLNEKQNRALRELIDGQISDRIVGIVGGAMLDDALRTILEMRLRETTDESLFRVNGALGSTAPKIELAYRLYVFDKPMRQTMHGIVEIRNQMAHLLETSFNSEDNGLTAAFGKLRAHEGLTHFPLPGDPHTFRLDPHDTRRDLFFLSLKLALFALMSDTPKHLPNSNIPTMSNMGINAKA